MSVNLCDNNFSPIYFQARLRVPRACSHSVRVSTPQPEERQRCEARRQAERRHPGRQLRTRRGSSVQHVDHCCNEKCRFHYSSQFVICAFNANVSLCVLVVLLNK